MRFFTLFMLCILLTAFHVDTCAQEFKKHPTHTFTKEDEHEFLLFKSRKCRNLAITSLIVGPLETAAGIYIVNKQRDRAISMYGTTNNLDQSAMLVGRIITATGIVTTLMSIPLFIASGKAKRDARLQVKDQSMGYRNPYVPVTGLSLAVKL